jgi:hypothetical protein
MTNCTKIIVHQKSKIVHSNHLISFLKDLSEYVDNIYDEEFHLLLPFSVKQIAENQIGEG